MEHASPLLIGLGNRLRSDDGAGIQLAEAIGAQASGIDVVLCQQLTPELAERISRASAVLFVDAWMRPSADAQSASGRTALSPLKLRPLMTSAGGDPAGHTLTPSLLLSLSAALYGPCPPAWQLLIPGEQWQVGDQLSPRTDALCRDAVPLVLAWSTRHA